MKIRAKIRAKYQNLSEENQKIALFFIVLGSLFLIYFIVHSAYILLFGHPNIANTPIFIRHGKQIAIPPGSPLRNEMQIKTIRLSSQPHILSVPGFVEANPTNVVNILPPMTGRLLSLPVSLGDQIEEGQVLAVINSPDFAQVSADYEKALSALKLATDILTRAKGVYKIGGNSIQAVQQAQNDYIQVKAEFERAKTKLNLLNNNKVFNGLLTIQSPIKGRITGLYYGMGSYVNDLTTPLMTVSNTDEVWVTANIPENLAGVIKVNQQVDIDFPAYPGQHFQGVVSFVNALLDPDTHRNKTRILLANPLGKLQPNMFATISISVKQQDHIMIPVSSVLMNNDNTSVYVESSPWVCQRREVQLGTEDGDQVSVLTGLKAGERIVTCGGVFLNDK